MLFTPLFDRLAHIPTNPRSQCFFPGYSIVTGSGATGLLRVLSLVPQDNVRVLKEIAEIRSSLQGDKTARSGQASIVDFGYALALTNHSRWAEAERLLIPFVEGRPKVVRARLLLTRVLIQQSKFTEAIQQLKSVVEMLPQYPQYHDEVVAFSASLIQFLSQARKRDCPQELVEQTSEYLARQLGKAYVDASETAEQSVRDRLEKIESEMVEDCKRINEEQDKKSAADLATANKARADSAALEQEFFKREETREKEASILRDEYNKEALELENLTREYNKLDADREKLRKSQRDLERTEKAKGSFGNETTRITINDQPKWDKLENEIKNLDAKLRSNTGQANQVRQRGQMLAAKIDSIAAENRADKIQTNKGMSVQIRIATKNESQAKRELQNKDSRINGVRASCKGRAGSFDTYLALNVLQEKQYLQATAEKFFATR